MKMIGSESTGPARSSVRAWFLAAVGILAVGLLLGRGIWERRSNLAQLRSVADEEAVPDVRVISPQPGPATRTLDLPGTMHAWYTAPIYGQVSGYVGTWYKDYGAKVKTGDLLATIITPSLDEQLATAQANVEVAEAKYRLAVVTATRWKALSGTNAVSQQEVDVNVANAEAQRAAVEAAKDEVARYQALEQFKSVVAPFDGVVTARSTDVGNYVNATGADAHAIGGATELFTVSDIHELRVYVSVPQDYSRMLKPGLTATLSLPQFSGRVYHAKYLTTAQAFDPQTRTVVTELTVDNPNDTIWPGTYANVHFVMPSDPDILIIPEQALLFRSEGMQVALVRRDGTVHLQDVKLGLNLGQTVQVVSGLQRGDRLIDDPSAAILEGEKVRVVPGNPSAFGDEKSAFPHDAVPDRLNTAQRDQGVEERTGPSAP
jgi:membrane fusion protein (multidrug efflux system)